MSPYQTYTRSLQKTPKVSNVVLTVCCVNHYNSHISLVALSYPLDHVWSHSPATQAAAHAVTDSLCGFLTIRRSHGLTSLTWSEPIVLHPSRSVTARSLSSSHLCTVCILCIYWDWDTICNTNCCLAEPFDNLSPLSSISQGWGWRGLCLWLRAWPWSRCLWCRPSAPLPPAAKTQTAR